LCGLNKLLILLTETNGNQPGDPKRDIAIILDFACAEGVVADKPTLVFIGLGSDTYSIVKDVLETK
jgi:hypothetical protein